MTEAESALIGWVIANPAISAQDDPAATNLLLQILNERVTSECRERVGELCRARDRALDEFRRGMREAEERWGAEQVETVRISYR